MVEFIAYERDSDYYYANHFLLTMGPAVPSQIIAYYLTRNLNPVYNYICANYNPIQSMGL